ncbi:MAG: T9SS type A sorting domain-containing protein, partial [Bacteroidota bacterium]|nr:T9SS type A sorting domain-containing protein [Bacteroidota bacterium]
WAKPDVSAPSHRVFQLWDIIGDHTGAVNPFLGNPPADTVNKNNGGYMLVINASYRIDSAFNQTITGLCPNTYYEFSLWIRNICSKCGCDSNGKGATATGYIPTATGDSSGVKPNLTLAINGVDYYTTGDVQYNGLWVKKGFTYLTGPSQTSLTAMVRNNAPGGGGNDWAIDDIALANCPPNLTMLPSPNVTVCDGNQVDISSVVTSYFSNYIYWQWEMSTDNGASWTNTGVSGVGSPTLVGGQWQYTAVYPSFLASASMNNAMYRLKVASTPGNLGATSCAFTASTTIAVLTNTCLALPGPDVNTFSGSLQNQTALLQWTTTNEKPGEWFSLERSSDGIHFTGIQDMPAEGKSNGSNYHYTDPNPVTGYAWYRLKITSIDGMRYSKTIALFSKASAFDFRLIGNPVLNSVVLQGVSASDRPVRLLLMNAVGTILQNKEWFVRAGANTITIDGLSSVPSGTYILQMQAGQDIKQFKLIKLRQ